MFKNESIYFECIIYILYYILNIYSIILYIVYIVYNIIEFKIKVFRNICILYKVLCSHNVV